MGGVRQKGNKSFPNSSVFKRKIKWSSSCLLFAPCPCLGGVSLCELLGLGLRPGCGSGCRLDSSDFTQGSVSPRGDREMSASVSLCLSSKPCQRQLSSHSITTLSLRVSLCFTIRDAQTVQARWSPPPPPGLLYGADGLRDNTHKVKVSVMLRRVALRVYAWVSRYCLRWCMKAGHVTLPGCFEWQCEWGESSRRLFVKAHLPSLPTSPSWQQTVTDDSPHKGRRGKGGRGYGD